MRLERLNYNKIKIFLTFDDLSERGLTQEDLWHDIPKVHQLFRDMMNEASNELGFRAEGPVAVEVFSLQAQGMVVIVTKGNIDYDEEDEFSDDYIEMQVTLDKSDDIFYEFDTFEDVIQVAIRLNKLGVHNGSLYAYNERFYLLLDEWGLPNISTDTLVAFLAEYGNSSTFTIHRIHEYGKLLMDKNAVAQLTEYFAR
ncbi:genetic competence negative regulator [Bacillus solimangrovi]|uniref:Adapter protein MecA n=1 Tax=Bacillus solimangrovi TaxID=1305675 RepID=A0A1E5LHC5_9BACI|nr:genetic competence negative regulator [Bacillus solimangrovi]OEH93484.1 adaptor protein [Bacillus solimangrovi]